MRQLQREAGASKESSQEASSFIPKQQEQRDGKRSQGEFARTSSQGGSVATEAMKGPGIERRDSAALDTQLKTIQLKTYDAEAQSIDDYVANQLGQPGHNQPDESVENTETKTDQNQHASGLQRVVSSVAHVDHEQPGVSSVSGAEMGARESVVNSAASSRHKLVSPVGTRHSVTGKPDNARNAAHPAAHRQRAQDKPSGYTHGVLQV